MKLFKSKTRLIFVLVYILLSAVSIIYSKICNIGICDVGYLLLPAIPWIGIIYDGSFGLLFYIISISLNIILFYWIFL